MAVVETHPVQYRAALWKRLARFPGLHPVVYYGSDFSLRGYHDREFGSRLAWDRPLLEGYESRILERRGGSRGVDFWNPRPGPVYRALLGSGAKVVVLNAYRGSFHLAAWWAAQRLGAGVVMRLEANDEAHGGGTPGLFLKKRVLRFLYGRCTHFAVTGAAARRHYLACGISRGRMHPSPYCVDTDHLEEEKKLWGPKRNSLRRKLGVRPGDTVLLFSGKMTFKKNPLLILAALRSLEKPAREKFHLVTMGGGELAAAMDREGRRVLGRRYHPLGFRNQRQMGEGYASADALVLPSRRGQGETWGLVVNEALQWGLPALVSDGVGCREDLVRPGQTGWIFTDDSPGSLAKCFESLLGLSAARRRAMPGRCLSVAKRHDLSAAAAGLEAAIRAVARRLES